jgi:predicted PurR-regulated permease PerM
MLSILVFIELFGFLGALLAVPAAGMIQVVFRDIYDENKGRIKEAITVGADEAHEVGPESD